MKHYKNSNNETYSFEDDCFDSERNAINETVETIINEKELIEISEEEYQSIIEANKPSQSEIRKAEIYAELDSIDTQTIRPLRAKLTGLATAQDEAKLLELETKASALRTELANLI